MNPLPPPEPRASPSSHYHDHQADNSGELRPWADFAVPLLDLILPRVTFLDCVRLSCVCRPWHESMADHPSLYRPLFPWLFFPQVTSSPGVPSSHVFWGPADSGASYRIHLPDDTKDMVCIASSHGWLYFAHPVDENVQGFLLNPLSKARIDLPTCPSHVCCAALSAAPTEPNCAVLVLSQSSIFHHHIGDETWKAQTMQFTLQSNITVAGGKFYFLCREGLAEMDCSRGSLLRWLELNDGVLPKWDDDTRIHRMRCIYYRLVESNGELLTATLSREKRSRKFGAHVCRADFANKVWAEVDNLGGRSLFLGEEACFSLPTVGAGKDGGCVYFIEGDYAGHFWRKYTGITLSSMGGSPSYDYGSVEENFVWSLPFYPIWFMPTVSTLH